MLKSLRSAGVESSRDPFEGHRHAAVAGCTPLAGCATTPRPTSNG